MCLHVCPKSRVPTCRRYAWPLRAWRSQTSLASLYALIIIIIIETAGGGKVVLLIARKRDLDLSFCHMNCYAATYN